MAECAAILASYYLDPSVPLSYAVAAEASDLFVGRSPETNSVHSFFFARMPENRRTGEANWRAYMGLTAVRDRAAPAFSARPLWTRFLADARESVGTGIAVLVWYRTATPFGFYPAHRLLLNGQPRIDGTFDDWGECAVKLLRSELGIPHTEGDEHPFVVRHYAKARYFSVGLQRNMENARPDLLRLLRLLDIQETKGDRVLMLGLLP